MSGIETIQDDWSERERERKRDQLRRFGSSRAFKEHHRAVEILRHGKDMTFNAKKKIVGREQTKYVLLEVSQCVSFVGANLMMC